MKNKAAITKFGGGEIQVLEVTSSGVSQVGAQWLNLGHIQESTLKDVTEQEDIKDETGATINSEDGDRTVKLTGLLMQTDKTTIDFLKEGVRGKYFAVFQKQGKVAGKEQEIFYGIAKIKPQVEIASGTKRPPFEVTVLKNESDVVFGASGLSLPTGAKATAVTIKAEDHYEIKETAIV